MRISTNIKLYGAFIKYSVHSIPKIIKDSTDT